jgi:hypothetical protein
MAGAILPQNVFGAEAQDSSRGRLTVKVAGDARSGYQAILVFRGRPIARHSGGGDFSAIFHNSDHSIEDRVDYWRAASYTENEDGLLLEGSCKLLRLNTKVSVRVEYKVVAPRIVRKRILFHQVDMYDLLYQLTNSVESVDPPASFWSFNELNCKGGPLREPFPAVGFRTNDNITVGLLTDSGYRNGWNRIVRRDGKPVKPAPHRITDFNLCYVCREDDRKRQRFFVGQTFGEEVVRNQGQTSGSDVSLPALSSWQKRGELDVHEQSGTTILRLHNPQASVVIPLPVTDSEIYSLRLKYRAKESFCVQLWDVDDRMVELQNLTLYNDRVPASPVDWSEFRVDIFVPSLQGRGALRLGMAESDQDVQVQGSNDTQTIEIRDLQISRIPTRTQPYHRLTMDAPQEKTSFIFVDDEVPHSLRGYRLASQQHLATGLGFRGGDTEKVLYADLMMLCWSAIPDDQKAMVAPSIWYSAAGEMYLRDSFFALNGIHNRELNERVFHLWAANQGEDGAINTLIEPYMANLERKSNDSTPLWLIWALRNRVRFGSTLPQDHVRKAAEYCLRTYDKRHDGVCWAQFVMGQLDVVDYPEGTSDICQNQGMLAVTLRVIKELRIPGVSDGIQDEYIAKAEEAYRSYYNPALKFICPARGMTDAIGFGEIFPEFLSLLLFGRKILSDEMVINHLERIPVLLSRKDAPFPESGGTVRPIFIGLTEDSKGWAYFSDSWHPMISKEHGANYANHNMDGIYYNGGSWMQIEVCGYVAGKLHGWKKADHSIANRLWAELNIPSDFPASHEYLATDPRHPFFGHHRVFAWNAFVLQALELAGLREAAADPDYRSS